MFSLVSLFAARAARRLAAGIMLLWILSPVQAGASDILSQDVLIQMGYAGGMCALTFDDGPGLHTPRLLDMLQQRNIKATFFLVGERIRIHPAIVRRIAEEGHEIGNHSMTHANLHSLSSRGQRLEIATVQEELRALGVECRLLRPPYGRYDAKTLQEADNLGLSVILWTVDTQDWQHRPSVAAMVSPSGRDKPSRGIYLLHDIHASTIDALPALIDYLQESGCTFVTVSEYLGEMIPPVHELPMSVRRDLSAEKSKKTAKRPLF